MPELKDFHVDENKVWFTGGYWPKGVPKQIYDLPDIEVLPLSEGFKKRADKLKLWDNDICIFVLGPYIERVKYNILWDYAKRFGTFLYDVCGIRKGDVVAVDLPNSINFVIAEKYFITMAKQAKLDDLYGTVLLKRIVDIEGYLDAL